MQKIIILTGIHGVGKDFIANQIRDKITIPIHSASKLIRMMNQKTDDKKRVEDIDKNQEILTESLKQNITEETLVLISHTCLLDKNGEIKNINNYWLDQLNIIGIILLYNDLKIINDQLNKRDNINFELNFLNKFQNQEKNNSIALAKRKNIPILKFKNGSELKSLIDFIEEII